MTQLFDPTLDQAYYNRGVARDRKGDSERALVTLTLNKHCPRTSVMISFCGKMTARKWQPLNYDAAAGFPIHVIR